MKPVLFFIIFLSLLFLPLPEDFRTSYPEQYSLEGLHENAESRADDSFVGETHYVSASFATELPLVILQSHQTTTFAAHSKNAWLQVIDTGEQNRLTSEVAYSGETSVEPISYDDGQPREKQDYFLTLTHETGGKNSASLLDMESASHWLLLGGMYDKSLLRNYLGYTLAGKVLQGAPQVRLCEVLLREGEQYLYQGVYLLARAEKDPNEVVIRRMEPGQEDGTQTIVAHAASGTYILLDYWQDATQEQIGAAGRAIESLDGMFFSSDTNTYLRYQEVIDVDAFASAFVLYESIGYYKDMDAGAYIYNATTQKLSPAPIWNFERSFDNDKNSGLDIKSLRYQNAPFYEYMVQHEGFLSRLTRVSKKEASNFQAGELLTLIGKAQALLGPAQQRDWYRWASEYDNGYHALSPYVVAHEEEDAGVLRQPDGTLRIQVVDGVLPPSDASIRIRQTKDYGQELIRLKYLVDMRPYYVRMALPLLSGQEVLLRQAHAYQNNTQWALAFLILYMATVAFARWKAES